MAKQTTLRTAEAVECCNISLPYGIVAMVRAGFRRLGLYGYLDGFKEKGVPLIYVIELMYIHQLDSGSSMNRCGAPSDRPLVGEVLCHGYRTSGK